MSTHRSHHGFNLGFDGDIGGEGDDGATGLLNLNGSRYVFVWHKEDTHGMKSIYEVQTIHMKEQFYSPLCTLLQLPCLTWHSSQLP